MSKQKTINEGGILGFESSSEKISDEEYLLIKAEIDKVIAQQTQEQKLQNKLIALRYKMEDYLEKTNPEKL